MPTSNGIVNGQDIAQIASHWLQTGGYGGGGIGERLGRAKSLELNALLPESAWSLVWDGA